MTADDGQPADAVGGPQPNGVRGAAAPLTNAVHPRPAGDEVGGPEADATAPEPLAVTHLDSSAGEPGAGDHREGDLEVWPAPEPLPAVEAFYAARSRAANTRRGYRSDWADFVAWCARAGVGPLPAAPATVTGYLTELAGRGTKVSTIARRLSSLAYAHRLAGRPNPVDDPRVQLVWEGVRRAHRAPTEHAKPLQPPELWDVLDALPDTPAGCRDAALLLVGFVGALRRSELAAARIEDLVEHPQGRVLTIRASKTDQHAVGQLVVLPRSSRPTRCPVAAVARWLAVAPSLHGPLFRPVHRSGRVLERAMGEAAVNRAVQRACEQALGPDHGYSAHSLRSGFATYAASRGASDRAIAHQTRHASLASLGPYIQHETAWTDNAATALGL